MRFDNMLKNQVLFGFFLLFAPIFVFATVTTTPGDPAQYCVAADWVPYLEASGKIDSCSPPNCGDAICEGVTSFNCGYNPGGNSHQIEVKKIGGTYHFKITGDGLNSGVSGKDYAYDLALDQVMVTQGSHGSGEVRLRANAEGFTLVRIGISSDDARPYGWGDLFCRLAGAGGQSCTYSLPVISNCDADGDGFIKDDYEPSVVLGGGDCDDAVAAINPGATEVCDGIDNNCVGGIDEGVKTTYYADLDGDGFGNLADPQGACAQPMGYVLDNTDCDDGNAAIKPGATEVCDTVDNDCDGTSDEGCACTNGQTQPCYTGPAGTQGIGVCQAGTQTCSAGVWGSCVGGVVPSTEFCSGGLDEDCDGLVDILDIANCVSCQDADGDGYNAVAQSCPNGNDCDDDNSNNPAGCPASSAGCDETKSECAICVHPGATEVCDGIDNNCVGGSDEGCVACTVGGSYIQDEYCENGIWTSRTKLIAIQLLDIVDKSVTDDYTLFCDSYQNTLNYYDYWVPGMGAVERYLTGYYSGGGSDCTDLEGNSIDCVNNFCVLKMPDQVIFGVSLNQPANQGFYNFLEGLELGANYCDDVTNINDGFFHQCSAGIGSAKVWYNSKTKSLIYSDKAIITNPSQFSVDSFWESFIIFLRNPYRKILNYLMNLLKDPNVTGQVGNHYNFVNNTNRFSRLYLDAKGIKTITGIVENVSDAGKEYMSVVYSCYMADMCDTLDIINERIKVGLPNKIICSHNSTAGKYYVTSEFPEGLALWPDLTAKLRTKDTGAYPNTPVWFNRNPEASPLSGVKPLDVDFEALLDGCSPEHDYTINFGDGDAESGTVVNRILLDHTYTDIGTYVPLLSVINTHGNSISYTFPNIIVTNIQIIVASSNGDYDINVGDQLQFIVSPTDKTYTWSIVPGGEAYCSIDNTGLLTGLAEGSCKVRATEDVSLAFDDSDVVTVNEIPPIGNLVCKIVSGNCQTSDGIGVLRLSGLTNAHAELYTYTNYGYGVCCKLENGVLTVGTGNGMISMSGQTNAHVAVDVSYTTKVNLTSTDTDVYCRTDTVCDSALGETCVLTLSGTNNAHAGDCSAYNTKVCCGVGDAPVCTPNCVGKQCGDDGCGGSCGNCLIGQVCQSGSCVLPTVEDCTNQIDDDGDTLVDCADTADCSEGVVCSSGICQGGSCVPIPVTPYCTATPKAQGCGVGICVLSLSTLTDAHATKQCNSNFGYNLCCPNTYTLDTSCQAGFVKLSELSDAHAGVYSLSTFTNQVCVKSSSSGTASCRYITSGSCASDETCFVSLSGTTDAHLSKCENSPFGTKICCKIT